jgi:hypothetical protein
VTSGTEREPGARRESSCSPASAGRLYPGVPRITTPWTLSSSENIEDMYTGIEFEKERRRRRS